MELWWFLIVISLFISFFLKSLLSVKKKNVPPGPPTIPFIGHLHLLTRPIYDLEPFIRELHRKYGPIVTLYIASRPVIFINNHSIAHQALIQKGPLFANRPPVPEANRILTSDSHNISSANYGPLWRHLRRNLVSSVFEPSRIRSYSHGRDWALKLLINNLKFKSQTNGGSICVMECLRRAIFCLLLFMCFGKKLNEKEVEDIEVAQRRLLLRTFKLDIFTFMPKIGKIVYKNRWKNLLEERRKQEELLTPLIEARREVQKKGLEDDFVFSYVDSLLTLKLPNEGGRKISEGEIVTLCSEFIDGGTEATSASLEWIMANLVKSQEIQVKLLEEIKRVVGEEEETIKEEDLNKMPYLKAIIMEGLRRHPPGHFVIPHAVSEEVSLGAYVIPKDTMVFFAVGEMGLDEKVWKDPMEFRPERFLEGEEVDITGSKEIKMMPFGVGRRICPGLNVGLLHLEYFVANLVREFEWKAKDGEEVDFSEKQEYSVVMKNPLEAIIVPRKKQR